MRFAPLLLLMIAGPVQARGWEWKRQPVTAADQAEIRRVATLTSLPRCQLEAVIEGRRDAFNQHTMLQYNRILPPTSVPGR